MARALGAQRQRPRAALSAAKVSTAEGSSRLVQDQASFLWADRAAHYSVPASGRARTPQSVGAMAIELDCYDAPRANHRPEQFADVRLVIPITGYTDRLSAAAGERIGFKVSSVAAGSYRASLARVVHADPNPAGPGVKIGDLADRFSIECTSRVQPLHLGSYARV